MESPLSHGFTLIELIVSVTLLLLLSGMFIANYTQFNNSQTVRTAALNLMMNLQAVRTSASSGVKPAGCDTLVGYRVDFTANGYTARARCLVSGAEAGVGETKTYTLPTNVKFTSIPGSGFVTFYALDRGASADETITLSGFGTTVNVSVSASGVVSE